ncbi:MAG: ABC transporter permease subunit [bacterium]|nr:ABC transporter permease subunit [bacterium]
MIAYILRRLGWSILTVFGVMLITFTLFRAMPGDIAAAHLGQKAKQKQRAEWLNKYGYDRPAVINQHMRLVIEDKTTGNKPFAADDDDTAGSQAANAFALFGEKPDIKNGKSGAITRLLGRFVKNLSEETPLHELIDGHPLGKVIDQPKPTSQPTTQPGPVNGPVIIFTLRDGTKLRVDLTELSLTELKEDTPSVADVIVDAINRIVNKEVSTVEELGLDDIDWLELFLNVPIRKSRIIAHPNATCGGLIDLINNHPDNKGKVTAGITEWNWTDLFDSQFTDHMTKSVTFQASSLILKKKLTAIIAQRAPASLALTIPAMAAGWFLAMIVSSFVAYYRGTILDKVGVFLSVLGMCVPFLAFMIYGQWLMFTLAPERAYGLAHTSNVYLPITIMVIAGLGGSVRFYRTVILDQVHRDYVRTARAKGASLPTVLFKHVLKNCMLPILTNLILSLPYLIMGSLLVETYFGIPGLGDLLLTSINGRDEPVVNAMVFLTAIVYTAGVMLTDISYAVFDPRIRLT